MPNPRLSYRPELDALRGIAVLLVFLQHAQVGGFGRAGLLGVTIFFTLSGFLITSLLLQERQSDGTVRLVRFYWRRALRLLPALVAMLVVIVATGMVEVPPVLAALSYSANWTNIAGMNMQVLGHTWSLAVEEHFYLLWPAVVLLVSGRDRLVALCLAGIAAAVLLRFALFDPADPGRVYMGTDTRADALLIGCLLAVLQTRLRPVAGLIGAAMIVTPLVAAFDGATFMHLGLPIAAVGTALLIASPVSLRWRPLVGLGTISYGFYLWHFPVIAFVRSTFRDMPAPALFLLFFAVTLAVAIASRVVVELPALSLRHSSPRWALMRTYAFARLRR